MKLTTIDAGRFKLDGGAMFGVVPKQLWSRLTTPDDNNMCTWAMRCLLVESGQHKILIDTGIGNKQDEKFRSHFEPHGTLDLVKSLNDTGIQAEEITDVLLTHFHFDHVGGAVSRDSSGILVPTFPNATYWSTESHYKWALEPNPREKASFLKENFVPLQDAGVLKFIKEKQRIDWLEGIQIDFVYGHTEAMMIPRIPFEGRHILYVADLVPSSFHVGMPYVMSYDVRPLETMKEKEKLYNELIMNEDILFFEHDPLNECGILKRDAGGRVVIDRLLDLAKL